MQMTSVMEEMVEISQVVHPPRYATLSKTDDSVEI